MAYGFDNNKEKATMKLTYNRSSDYAYVNAEVNFNDGVEFRAYTFEKGGSGAEDVHTWLKSNNALFADVSFTTKYPIVSIPIFAIDDDAVLTTNGQRIGTVNYVDDNDTRYAINLFIVLREGVYKLHVTQSGITGTVSTIPLNVEIRGGNYTVG